MKACGGETRLQQNPWEGLAEAFLHSISHSGKAAVTPFCGDSRWASAGVPLSCFQGCQTALAGSPDGLGSVAEAEV